MVTFQKERVTDCFEEAFPLLLAHWAEVAHFKDIPLKPDWTLYAEVEAKGALRTYTIRESGKLVGYAVFFVRTNAHYADSVQAVQDIVYLDPDMRAPTTGIRFLAWCDEQLQAEGIEAVYHHVKRSRDFGPILRYLGYENIETVWVKRLKARG